MQSHRLCGRAWGSRPYGRLSLMPSMRTGGTASSLPYSGGPACSTSLNPHLRNVQPQLLHTAWGPDRPVGVWQVAAVADPPKQFRVDTAGAPLAKWGKNCNWTSRDDAMLMLGVHWCGSCAALKACPSLGFQAALGLRGSGPKTLNHALPACPVWGFKAAGTS